MLYDLAITPAQLAALAEWCDTGWTDRETGYRESGGAAQIELRAVGPVLVAGQGDAESAWNADGFELDPAAVDRLMGRLHDADRKAELHPVDCDLDEDCSCGHES